MRASTVRLLAALALLLALAASQHWIGPGPDGPARVHASHTSSTSAG